MPEMFLQSESVRKVSDDSTFDMGMGIDPYKTHSYEPDMDNG